MAVEEPAFRSVVRAGAFEIRDYPPLIVAEVRASGDQKAAAGQGFRMLAGYIFGGNQGKRSIAMTAPVAQARTGETIAMTAPVAQAKVGGDWIVRFTMPRAYTLETLPVPTDSRVHLKRLAAERAAVIRFSGLAFPSDVAARTTELRAWLAKRGTPSTGAASLAQYDPPWTPWFMRRNEVMIPMPTP